MWFTDFNNTSKQSYRGRKYNFNMNKTITRIKQETEVYIDEYK